MSDFSVPNAVSAIVVPIKLRDYLLSHVHPVGRHKARAFAACGYFDHNWDDFSAELKRHVVEGGVVQTIESEHGVKYIVEGNIACPSRQLFYLRSVWILEKGSVTPRFVTAYPG